MNPQRRLPFSPPDARAFQGSWMKQLCMGSLLVLTVLSLCCTEKLEFIARVEQLSSPQAIDCGHAHLTADPSPVARCAMTALSQGRAFRAVITHQGTDSVITSGFVRTPVGRLIEVIHDSDRSGGHRFRYKPGLWEHSCEAIAPQVIESLNQTTLKCL